MKIKNNLIFSFIFGTLIISFIIWNRFIRIRLPRELLHVEYINNAGGPNKEPITKHETTHTNIMDVASGKVVAILTSGHGNTTSTVPGLKKDFDKVSTEKHDGTYTPVFPKSKPQMDDYGSIISPLSTISKAPIIDNYGSTIPNPNAGGQYMATLGSTRIPRDPGILVEKSELQPYLDKYEARIAQILSTKDLDNRPTIERVNKNKSTDAKIPE